MQPTSAEVPPPDSDVLDLLQRCAWEQALGLLLERYEAKIHRLCCSMLRDETQAEDASQESWVRIWKALPRFDRRASLSTWIYAITRNRCLTAIERRRNSALMNAEDNEAEMAALETGPVDVEDQAAVLRGLVDLLPERHRRVLTLFYYEDCSVAEVADMLKMPAGTVKTLLYRARAALGQQLKERGLDDPKTWWEAQT